MGDGPVARKIHSIHLLLRRSFRVLMIVSPLAIALYLVVGFLVPTKVQFVLGSTNCIHSPALFPDTLRASSEVYDIEVTHMIRAGSVAVASFGMCVSPRTLATDDEPRVSMWGLPMTKKISVVAPATPIARALSAKDETVSAKDNIIFNLSEPDIYHEYILEAQAEPTDDALSTQLVNDGVPRIPGKEMVECTRQYDAVSCPVMELGLRQGQQYAFSLLQSLGGASKEVYNQTLSTVEPIEVVQSTITAGQVVYDSPASMVITFNKQPIKANGVAVYESGELILVSYAVQGNSLEVTWASPLARQKEFRVVVSTVVSADGGQLTAPIDILFTSSGGPKVLSHDIPASKASADFDYQVTFDHAVDSAQDFGPIFSIRGQSGEPPLRVVVDGAVARVRTLNALSSCTEYTIKINPNLRSVYGHSGGNEYTATFRTKCSRQFSIGSSVEGRSINAYALGGGPDTVVYVAGVHGNEKSGYYLLASWLDYLESNPGTIPADKTVVILPLINPDGFARNSRFNARNIDLNRNFGSANWKTDVVVPGGSILAGGGGAAPLSEPESRALVEYIERTRPSLVMSYHSQGSIVIANGSGGSNALAQRYATEVEYDYVPTEVSASAFEHDTTGAFEDWLYEVPNIPTVLLELSSHTTNSIFPYHRQPMTWALAE